MNRFALSLSFLVISATASAQWTPTDPNSSAIRYNGNVGVGRDAVYKFELAGSARITSALWLGNFSPSNTTLGVNAIVGNVPTVIVNGHASQTDNLIEVRPGSGASVVRIDKDGRLGIGLAPLYALDVAGSARASGAMWLGNFQPSNTVLGAQSIDATQPTAVIKGVANQTVDLLQVATSGSGAFRVRPDPADTSRVLVDVTNGTIVAHYQDVAEWVPSRERLSPGTVVVLDPDRANHVLASATPYDTAVAGVVSAQPGILLGESSPSKAMIATTGRVKVMVDASFGAIRIGDLLVTSQRRGMAMRSQPIDVGGARIHRPGTVIGKALEALPSGQGEILVLLSLQ